MTHLVLPWWQQGLRVAPSTRRRRIPCSTSAPTRRLHARLPVWIPRRLHRPPGGLLCSARAALSRAPRAGSLRRRSRLYPGGFLRIPGGSVVAGQDVRHAPDPLPSLAGILHRLRLPAIAGRDARHPPSSPSPGHLFLTLCFSLSPRGYGPSLTMMSRGEDKSGEEACAMRTQRLYAKICCC